MTLTNGAADWETRKRGKTLSKNHYHYLFLKGWKWWDKSGTVTKKNEKKCREMGAAIQYEDIWQQGTISPCETFHQRACGKCYGRGPEWFRVCYQNCDWIFRVLIWQMKYEKKKTFIFESFYREKNKKLCFCRDLLHYPVKSSCRSSILPSSNKKCFGGGLRTRIACLFCSDKTKLQGTVQLWA